MAQYTDQIYTLLVDKGSLKQKVFDNTLQTLRLFKQASKDLETEINQKLQNIPEARIRLKFKNITQFQAELKVAGDMLIFFMHSNIFLFDKNHPAWKSSVLKNDPKSGYIGMIYIYNFLADSFKYNRTEDMGLLIRRIFVNKDNLFWLEEVTPQDKVNFYIEPQKVEVQAIRQIVEEAVLFAMNFDLQVLPYQRVNLTTVEEILEARKIGAPTGKKVGFDYSNEQNS
jgi:hypothetical protein